MNTPGTSTKKRLITGSLFDLLLGFVGWYVICFVPLSTTATTLDDPFRTAFGVPPAVVTLVFAFPLATAHWLRNGSIDALGSFVLLGTLVFFAVGLLAMILLGILNAAPSTESLESFAMNTVFMTIIYSVTYLLVYKNGLDTLRQRI